MTTLLITDVTELLVESDNGFTMNLYIVEKDGTKTNVILFGADKQRPTTHECDSLGDKI